MVSLRLPRSRGAGLATAAVIGMVAAAVVLAPLPVVLGAGRLAALAMLAVGVGLTVGRAGVVDLGAGAVAAAGAYLGGVLAGLRGWPMLVGLLVALLAGAVVGAVMAAVAGRVGRTLSAVTSLALAAAVVAAVGGWPAAGGAAGFHAVPLLTGSDRLDLAVVLVLLVLAVAVAVVAASGPLGARASVAVHGPAVARSLGRSPARDAAVLGAVGGAIVGAGGAVGAALTGSVAPAAYGLGLSAGLAVAAVVGGALPFGPVLGALLVWGPGHLWPLVPLIGDAPALLVMGPVALAVRAWRGGPLLPWPEPSPTTAAATSPPERRTPAIDLEVRGFPLRDGSLIDLDAPAGTVTAVIGPNGAGKSTLLAAVAGQVDDGGTVTWNGEPPPRGAAARARAGVARSWQRRPSVPLGDALAVATADPAATPAADGLRRLLGPSADTDAGRELLLVAARRPSLVLLDEPAAELPVPEVLAALRWFADLGAAVVAVEHRREIVAAADRTVRLGEPTDG